MQSVYITYKDNSSNDRTPGTGNWDHSWSEYHDIHSYRASLSENTFSEAHPLVGDLKPGDNIAIVIISYSHGDSFGRSSGNQDVLWAGSVEQAMEVCEVVNNMFPEDEDRWGKRRLKIGEHGRHSTEGTQYTFPGHERATYMGTYDDYFGGFDGCRVEVLPLNP